MKDPEPSCGHSEPPLWPGQDSIQNTPTRPPPHTDRRTHSCQVCFTPLDVPHGWGESLKTMSLIKKLILLKHHPHQPHPRCNISTTRLVLQVGYTKRDSFISGSWKRLTTLRQAGKVVGEMNERGHIVVGFVSLCRMSREGGVYC